MPDYVQVTVALPHISPINTYNQAARTRKPGAADTIVSIFQSLMP